MFRIKEDYTEFPGTLYAVYLYKTNLSQKDIYSIINTLIRYRKVFPEISFLLTISNTDSSHCVRRTIMTGKRGRPINAVLGKKINKHIHLAIVGDEEHSPYKYLKSIQKAFNKRFKNKVCVFGSKGRTKHAINFINYSLKQCSSYRKTGIFNEILEEKSDLKTQYL